MNIKSFEDDNIFLILVDEYENMVKDKLIEYSLAPSKNIIIDTSIIEYENCIVNFNLEHFVVVKKGKIVFAESYYPSEISQMKMDILTK